MKERRLSTHKRTFSGYVAGIPQQIYGSGVGGSPNGGRHLPTHASHVLAGGLRSWYVAINHTAKDSRCLTRA